MSKNVYKIAHLRDQGKSVIIIPIANSNNDLSNVKLNQIKKAFQAHAAKAKLSGDICLVWESNSKLSFLAPNQWKTFCMKLNMNIVKQYINKELTV